MKTQIACLGAVSMLIAVLGRVDAAPNCNTRGGQVENQPDPPTLAAPAELVALPDDAAAEISLGKRNLETIPLRLETHIDSLTQFDGPYTTQVPVLLLRLENYEAFDQKVHCNRIVVILIKPRIEEIGAGRYKATYDQKKFSTEFSRGKQLRAWEPDAESKGRLIWIFPAVFGKQRNAGMTPWQLTASYDEAFRSAPRNSPKRRWIAEAYLQLALRTYRKHDLNEKYPRHHVSQADISELLKQASHDCNASSREFLCLLAALIEMNEVKRGSENRFADDVFRAGDALLENSGISAGIRQLDFASKNAQARALAPKLIPSLFSKDQLGYGWRRPIRLWEVEWLNNWYATAGRSANERLSEREAQWMLLNSHVEYLQSAEKTLTQIANLYPRWPTTSQTLLALISSDLENVSGYTLRLSKEAASHCAVLNDRTLGGSKRSNWGVARNQRERVKNAFTLVRARFGETGLAEC